MAGNASVASSASVANISDFLVVVCADRDNALPLRPVPLGLTEGTLPKNTLILSTEICHLLKNSLFRALKFMFI